MCNLVSFGNNVVVLLDPSFIFVVPKKVLTKIFQKKKLLLLRITHIFTLLIQMLNSFVKRKKILDNIMYKTYIKVFFIKNNILLNIKVRTLYFNKPITNKVINIFI